MELVLIHGSLLNFFFLSTLKIISLSSRSNLSELNYLNTSAFVVFIVTFKWFRQEHLSLVKNTTGCGWLRVKPLEFYSLLFFFVLFCHPKQATPWFSNRPQWRLLQQFYWQRFTQKPELHRGCSTWCRAARRPAASCVNILTSPKCPSLGASLQDRRFVSFYTPTWGGNVLFNVPVWDVCKETQRCLICGVTTLAHEYSSVWLWSSDYGDGVKGDKTRDFRARWKISSDHLSGQWCGECCEGSSHGQLPVTRPGGLSWF